VTGYLLGLSILVSLLGARAIAAEPWSILPNGCVQTDRDILCDPFTVDSADDIAITGTVDFEFVRKKIERLGYLPIRLPGGSAIGGIEAIDYHQTFLGPYREVILYFAAERIAGDVHPEFLNTLDFLSRFAKFNVDPMNPEIVYFVERLILDSVDAQEEPVMKAIYFGRYVYGFRKERGPISLDFSAPRLKSFHAKSTESGFAIDCDLQSLFDVNSNISARRNIYLLSEKNDLPVLSRSDGTVYASVPMPVSSSNQKISLGSDYEQLNFKAQYWVYQIKPSWKFAPLARFQW
jgi:hypothetical protein